MSSLSAKDRVSLCSFTFADGRRCRTPRTGKNPRFCFYHAQKEARAAKKLGKDLAYFFSGDYLSACDLSAALGRLIPAVVRGDVRPPTPLPTWPNPSCRPSTSPSTNTSTPSARTAGPADRSTHPATCPKSGRPPTTFDHSYRLLIDGKPF
jgi:hypothetical protein